MVTETYNRWVEIFSDLICLRILFYLRDYNPNIPLDKLESVLHVDKKKLAEKITKMIKADIIEVDEETPAGLSLTQYGRVGVERIQALTK